MKKTLFGILFLITNVSAFAGTYRYQIKGYIRDIQDMQINHNRIDLKSCKEFMDNGGYAECEGQGDWFLLAENYLFLDLPNPTPASYSIDFTIISPDGNDKQTWMIPLNPGLRSYRKVAPINPYWKQGE